MTHEELAEVLLELEGQRRALAEKGYPESAAGMTSYIGAVVSNHIIEIAAALKYWDAPLAITQQMIKEILKVPTYPAPTRTQ